MDSELLATELENAEEVIEKLSAKIARLERENAALEKRLQEIQRMCLGYQDEHAGLRKDAARYRAIRNGVDVDTQSVICVSVVDDFGGETLRGEAADAAIDAAMKEKS